MSPSASALTSFLLTRVLVVVIALSATALFPIATPCGSSCHLSAVPILDALSRWDGGWYLGIARDGYGYTEGAQSDLAFFPLYPAAMRALGALGGGSDDAYLAAGILLSNLALLAAAVLLARLVALDFGARAAAASVALLLLFPTTVILSAVYAESLFLACAIAALYFARTERWPLAAFAGAAAALARPFGFLVAVPLALEAWRRGDRSGILAPLAPVGAFVAWMAILWRMTGDPLAFFSAQSAYGRRAAFPGQAIVDLFDPATYGNPFFIIAFGGAMAALVAVSWRVLPRSLAAYGTVFFLAALSSGTLTSLLRYSLAVFPAFIALAVIPSAWARRIYVAAAGMIAVLFTAMFALWYWIG